MENHKGEKTGTVQQVSLHITNSWIIIYISEIHWTCSWCGFLSFQMDNDRDCLLSSHKDTGKSGTSSMSSASFNFINSIIGSGIIGNVLLFMLLQNNNINLINTHQILNQIYLPLDLNNLLKNINCTCKYCYKVNIIIIMIINWWVRAYILREKHHQVSSHTCELLKCFKSMSWRWLRACLANSLESKIWFV